MVIKISEAKCQTPPFGLGRWVLWAALKRTAAECVLVAFTLSLAPPALAQEPAHRAANQPAHSTRLILLGTGGGPLGRMFRSQPASLLVVDGHLYLIDCGAGVIRQLAWVGYQAGDIQDVFLTHLHADHTSGLPSLTMFAWVHRTVQLPSLIKSSGVHRLVEMNIYGPPGTELLVHRALQFDAISEALFAAELPRMPAMDDVIHAHNLNITAPTTVFQDGRVRVTAVENSHYSVMHIGPQPYGPVKSYAYRFETASGSVVFTGDTGPSQALAQLAKGANILVSEVISRGKAFRYVAQYQGANARLHAHMWHEHLTPEEVGKLASEAGVKMVVLTHLIPGLDTERDTTAYTAGVSKHYKGPVVAGRDLDEFDLNGPAE